jgi:hypothetical protein
MNCRVDWQFPDFASLNPGHGGLEPDLGFFRYEIEILGSVKVHYSPDQEMSVCEFTLIHASVSSTLPHIRARNSADGVTVGIPEPLSTLITNLRR